MLASSSPIYVGFSGPAGSGKTTTANEIAPGGIKALTSPIVFDHYFLAKPLYDIVSTKRLIQGDDAKSRMLYEIHDTVSEVLGRNMDYDDLIELVYDIYCMDAGKESDSKPRSFMQQVGDMMRAVKEDCFVDVLIRRAQASWWDTLESFDEADKPIPFNFVLTSDTRRINEFNKLREQPNSVLIRLEASQEVLNNRLLERDGHGMTAEQWAHPTETEARNIPTDWFDLILDTNELDKKQQAKAVHDFLIGMINYSIVDGKYVENIGVS